DEASGATLTASQVDSSGMLNSTLGCTMQTFPAASAEQTRVRAPTGYFIGNKNMRPFASSASNEGTRPMILMSLQPSASLRKTGGQLPTSLSSNAPGANIFRST